MNPSFASTALLSFSQWLDNQLLQKGRAYTNCTSRLYYKNDPRIGSNYVTYQAPFKSFVWDSGVTGATIISSISGNFGTLGRGQSGMMMDFENGRAILPATFGVDKIVSGSYAFKDFNIYFANQSQEDTIFTNKYYLNSRFNRKITDTPPPYDFVTPAIFISNIGYKDDPFQFGGVYNSTMTISLVVLAENLQQLEGALSIFADTKDFYFPQLDADLWPLNFHGDWKSGYNYEDMVSRYGTSENLFNIERVTTSKLADGIKINESVFAGIADFTVIKPRIIHG